MGHTVQLGATSGLCRPAAQMRHSVAAASEYVPPAQMVHSVRPYALSSVTIAARSPL